MGCAPTARPAQRTLHHTRLSLTSSSPRLSRAGRGRQPTCARRASRLPEAVASLTAPSSARV